MISRGPTDGGSHLVTAGREPYSAPRSVAHTSSRPRCGAWHWRGRKSVSKSAFHDSSKIRGSSTRASAASKNGTVEPKGSNTQTSKLSSCMSAWQRHGGYHCRTWQANVKNGGEGGYLGHSPRDVHRRSVHLLCILLGQIRCRRQRKCENHLQSWNDCQKKWRQTCGAVCVIEHDL
eukprot:2260161-Rhodomonas_salina.2